jgi:hypothetical protein
MIERKPSRARALVLVCVVAVNDVVALARRSTKCPGLAADPVVLVGLLGASDGTPANAEAHFDNALFEAN